MTYRPHPGDPFVETLPIGVTKACAGCKEERPVTQFGFAPRMRDGLKSYCTPCLSEYGRELRAKDPEAARAAESRRARARYTPERGRRRHLKDMYGLAPEEYDQMLAAQGGRCAICEAPTAGGKGDWHVDHCHESGANRGLLCSTCNVGLGMFRDNPDLLLAAARYVTRSRQEASA